MTTVPRGIRAITPVTAMCAGVLLFLAVVPSAQAVTDLTINLPNPVVGDLVSAEGPYQECANNVPGPYIAKVSAGVGAAVKIVGVRYDLVMGRGSTISIKANKQSAGRIGKKWRPGKICT
jgi:hypothetical protein